MEEYHLKYHDDVYTDRRGVLLPYKRLMGMCCWMGSHFHNWIDYNGVAPRNTDSFDVVFFHPHKGGE